MALMKSRSSSTYPHFSSKAMWKQSMASTCSRMPGLNHARSSSSVTTMQWSPYTSTRSYGKNQEVCATLVTEATTPLLKVKSITKPSSSLYTL
jgi:hypothetical protein